MPSLSGGALARERKRMQVYRRAFLKALAQTPDPSGDYAHALEALDELRVGLDPYSDLILILDHVTLFERNHPDVTMLQSTLAMTATDVDDLFRLAISIEQGTT